MKYLSLALFPLVVAALTMGLTTIDDLPTRAWVMRGEIETVKILALAGAWAAMLAFERGEYLRRAWFLSGLCYALLLIRDVTFAAPVVGVLGDVDTVYVRSTLVLSANLSAVIGTCMIARAWKVAGLELPGSRWAQGLVIGGAIVIALTLTGPTTANDVRRVVDGDPRACEAVASDLGDIVSLCLIAPVLLTAIALRGGLLRWPWALFTASMLSWLFYDAAYSLGSSAAANSASHRAITEAFRALACGYGFAAGVAQRLVVKSTNDA
jgi:hypothetical protein